MATPCSKRREEGRGITSEPQRKLGRVNLQERQGNVEKGF